VRQKIRQEDREMSDFRIRNMILGDVSTNCYIIFHASSHRAVIVDPADNAPYIMKKCKELDVVPEAILLTHGHFDHILAVKDVKNAYGCKVYVGREDERMLEDPSLNLSGTLGTDQQSFSADELVRDGQVLSLIGFDFRVIETPGHTSGSVCYYVESEGVLISGDTLFEGSLGRTDLPTGSSRQIVDSILQKLLVLPEDTMVYPGHGGETTIQFEKRYNPVVAYARRNNL
jgi:glyoxylase-like metal-dependent hydrolase (beta-lactamase superfamily II)